MSWFSTGLAKATSWLDTTFNTGGWISGAATSAYTYGSDLYDSYIKDSFLEETAINFATGAATNALTGGQQQQGMMPQQGKVSAAPSSVNVVRPNIARRGPTKSLKEASIGSLRS